MKAIIAAAIAGVIMMFVSVLVKEKKPIVTWATLLMCILFGVSIGELATTPKGVVEPLFNNMILISREGLWFNMLMTGCSLLYLLLVRNEIQNVGKYVAEYTALIFFIL